MSEFQDKVVAVLNAATEIGLCVTRELLSHGAKIIVIEGHEGQARVKADLADVAGAGKRLAFVAADDEPGTIFDRGEQTLGKLDILVCAAPPISQISVLDMQPAMLREIVGDELIAPALIMQEAGRRMASRGCGRIITFLSMSAKTGVHTRTAPFAAAKGGLLTYTRVMAAELAPFGVTVNAIATSLFEPQLAAAPPDEREALRKGIPVRRFGKVAEAAHAVLFLASSNAGFITGETMNMSGGRFMD